MTRMSRKKRLLPLSSIVGIIVLAVVIVVLPRVDELQRLFGLIITDEQVSDLDFRIATDVAHGDTVTINAGTHGIITCPAGAPALPLRRATPWDFEDVNGFKLYEFTDDYGDEKNDNWSGKSTGFTSSVDPLYTVAAGRTYYAAADESFDFSCSLPWQDACANSDCEATEVAALSDVPHVLTLRRSRTDGSSVTVLYAIGDPVIKVVTCHDAACSDPDIADIDTGTPFGLSNSLKLALGPDGNPRLLLKQGNVFSLIVCSDAMCSQYTQSQVNPQPPQVIILPEIDVASNGNPVITYVNTTATPPVPHIIRCADATCSAYADEPVAATFNVFFGFFLDSADRAVFMHGDTVDGGATSTVNVRVSRCNVAGTCSLVTTSPILLSDVYETFNGYGTIIGKEDSGGNPFILLTDTTTPTDNTIAFKILRCSDSLCATNVSRTISVPNESAGFIKLLESAGGLPLIQWLYIGVSGYYDQIGLAKCGDSVCNTSTQITKQCMYPLASGAACFFTPEVHAGSDDLLFSKVSSVSGESDLFGVLHLSF